jgi:ligand-binding sensor domain-containing protein/signal transduction histidine kinase
MLKTRWILTLAILWLLSSGGLLAGTPGIAYRVDRVWTSDEGLPEMAVLSLAQTREGYLWLGTLNGLVRFDAVGNSSGTLGTKFPVFNESNTPELGSSRIIKLFEDSRGNLWVGTEAAGVVVIAPDGTLTRPDLPASQGRRLISIGEDRQGAIWLYLADGQLVRCQGSKVDSWNIGGPSQSRALAIDDEGVLWVGTDRNLSALSPAGSSTSLLVTTQVAVRKLDFILPSRGGGYWRFADGEIQRWKGNRKERDLAAYPVSWTNVVITAACEDRYGNLFVGTYGDGLYWFTPEGGVAKVEGLSHSSILSLVIDREGCIWAGTNGGGLNRIKRQVFDVLPVSRGNTVQSVCDDGEGGLWIGYNGETVQHWSKGVARDYRLQYPLLAVRSVFVDRESRVWAGAFVGGLFQKKAEQFEQVAGFGGVANANVSVIFQDPRGTLWIGTQGGLAVWNGTNWKTISAIDGLSANQVQAIAEDRAGNLWIGTEGGGLNRFKDGQFTRFNRTNGLPSNNIHSLCVDEQGVLWVGTASGLVRHADNQWFEYSTEGLSDHSIFCIVDDGQGYLWVGSNAGVLRVAKQALNNFAKKPAGSGTQSLPIRAYTKSDGLPASECAHGSQPSVCRSRDGRLWFATILGLAVVDPARVYTNSTPPPVLIDFVSVDGRIEKGIGLRPAPPTSITIPAGKESLEIHFTSLNLSAPEKGLFRYRLEGFENAWKELPGSARFVRYPRLPHGDYTFRVTACNEDLVWNETGVAMTIVVLPPFWQTWWFISVMSLLVLAGIVGAVHFVSTQKLQRQLALLRQQEMLEKERSRIARDLHDQLGANLTQVALLGELAETDKNLPDEVEDHARMISQTARDTTRALDEIVWTVNPANDTVDGLVNYICKYAQEYLALAGLRYRLEVPPRLPGTPISPELRHNVFLVAKEAVNNVVKHARASSAWVRLRLEENRFIFEVEDDGRGISKEDENKGRNGLRNMRKRMEDIGGTFSISPRAEKGTIVRLAAPLNHLPHPPEPR